MGRLNRSAVGRQDRSLHILPTIELSPPSRLHSAEDWAARIRRAWGGGTVHTLQLARMVTDARRHLRRGEWGRLWRSKRLFSRRKAQMLLVIWNELGIVQNSAQLPAAWSTLYLLARLGTTLVDQLVSQGEIHPGLTLKQARALLARHRPSRECAASSSSLRQRLARFSAFVRSNKDSWSRAERQSAYGELLKLAQEIQPQALASRTIPEPLPIAPFPPPDISVAHRTHFTAQSLVRNSTPHKP